MEKKILVTRSSMPSYEEYINEIKELWDSHWLTNMGKKHNQLKKELENYLIVNNVELMVNGHMSLEVALQALDIGGEVITTPFTFASTTHAIVRRGLTPVFCDINEYDYTIDVSKIEELITDKTQAIMPVHVYGNVCDVDEIQKIADKYGLKVIYDAAHTFGVKYKNKGIASYGDISCYSFHATKVFNTIEGGAVCFNDDSLREKVCKIRDFGIKDEETIDCVGTNAKMNEFCAAMGLCNLRHVDNEIEKRKHVVEKYREYLDGIEGIKLNPIQKNVQSNYAYFPIVIDEDIFGKSRDEVTNRLLLHNISARKYFFPITNTFECFKGKYNGKTPIAEKISNRVLTLPLYADLCDEDIERICKIILECKSNE